MAPAKTIKATQWEGLSLCRVLRKRDLQSTDRLTQEKCQLTRTTFCSGGKSPTFFLLSRSGNEWLVEDEKYIANLKASVGENQLIVEWLVEYERYGADLKASVGEDMLILPTTGWKFGNTDTQAYEEDRQLRCKGTPSSSSCSVTVSLSGLAKEIQGECEGEYNDTGLRSAGRKVINFLM